MMLSLLYVPQKSKQRLKATGRISQHDDQFALFTFTSQDFFKLMAVTM